MKTCNCCGKQITKEDVLNLRRWPKTWMQIGECTCQSTVSFDMTDEEKDESIATFIALVGVLAQMNDTLASN